MDTKHKKLFRGIDDFKALREAEFRYINKSLFIEEVCETSSKVLLTTRPRCFGKSLNLSILRYFWEKSPQDTRPLFEDLKVWENPLLHAEQGQFPVIFLSLKDCQGETWEQASNGFQQTLKKEFERHAYILNGATLSDADKDPFQRILQKKAEEDTLRCSLFHLICWLHDFHKKNRSFCSMRTIRLLTHLLSKITTRNAALLSAVGFAWH
jgi:hypothetical protein